jgi:hypothetical protein
VGHLVDTLAPRLAPTPGSPKIDKRAIH